MPSRLNSGLILAAALAAFLATDSYFTLIQDEVMIVSAAQGPVRETIWHFTSGSGQHEHPPLSDILIHSWLPLAGSRPYLLRLPSVLCFLAGLLVFAYCAQKLTRGGAFMLLLWLGCLWPFGFHFARLVGWYSFCFLLVALLTLTYLHYWEQPSWRRFAAHLACEVLLVYSNYFGWAIVGCLLLDASIRRRRQALRFVGTNLVILGLAYIPLWHAFLNEVAFGVAPVTGRAFLPGILNGAAKLQSVFVSDSVAPWFWYFTVPVWIAIVTILVIATRTLTGFPRALLIYFGVLFGCMTIIGIVGTRRLLFVAGWLLLPCACALAQARERRRKVIASALIAVAAIGWTGTWSRRFYAAQDFLEPWQEVASHSAALVKDGVAIVTNSPVFLFYLSPRLASNGAHDSQVYFVDRWRDLLLTSPPAEVLFVVGVNKSADDETEAARRWLKEHCRSLSSEKMVPDSGYALKSRWFPLYGQQPFRIQMESFACSEAHLSHPDRKETTVIPFLPASIIETN